MEFSHPFVLVVWAVEIDLATEPNRLLVGCRQPTLEKRIAVCDRGHRTMMHKRRGPFCGREVSGGDAVRRNVGVRFDDDTRDDVDSPIVALVIQAVRWASWRDPMASRDLITMAVSVSFMCGS